MEAASLCPAGSPAQTRRPGVLSVDSGSGVSQRRTWRLVHEQSSQFLAGFPKQALGVLWGAGRPSGEFFSDQGLPCGRDCPPLSSGSRKRTAEILRTPQSKVFADLTEEWVCF